MSFSVLLVLYAIYVGTVIGGHVWTRRNAKVAPEAEECPDKPPIEMETEEIPAPIGEVFTGK